MCASAVKTALLPLPRRRRCGITTKCHCGSNSAASATAFTAPSPALVLADRQGVLKEGLTFLEVGAGNLRNARYIQRSVNASKVTVVENPNVVQRFGDNYKVFESAGGITATEFPARKFDVVVLTYVLETICPPNQRLKLIRDISCCLKPSSSLILSVRGYGGVRGRQYRRCRFSDGYVGARGAFVRAYSLGELQAFLNGCGLSFQTLQQYRSERPENIHGIAKLRED